MAKVTKIKVTAFCDHIDHAVLTDGVFTAKKHRPFDTKGVYKATEAFQLELDKKDIPGLITNKHGKTGYSATWDVVDHYRAKGLLPNERLLIYVDDYKWDFVNEHGFNTEDKPPYIRKDTTTLTVFAISDFVKLKPTPKEEAAMAQMSKRTKMQSINSLLLKDTIIETLKNANYEVESNNLNDRNAALYFKNKKNYNAMIKDAMEYYLNNVIFKGAHCRIRVPEQKPTHGYKYDDPLCYLGDIELVDEGE